MFRSEVAVIDRGEEVLGFAIFSDLWNVYPPEWPLFVLSTGSLCDMGQKAPSREVGVSKVLCEGCTSEGTPAAN